VLPLFCGRLWLHSVIGDLTALSRVVSSGPRLGQWIAVPLFGCPRSPKAWTIPRL
jgi:hypothetical protein